MTKNALAADAPALPGAGPDRRAMLTSAGAAALIAATASGAVAVAATPSADADAALWALRSRYLAARHAQAAEKLPRTPAEQAIIDAAPRVPMFGAGEEVCAALAMRSAALDVLSWPKPTAASEARFTAALDAECRVIDEIIATPARTLAGLAFKAGIVTAEAYLNNELTHPFMLDIATFAAAHPTLALLA